MEKTNASVLVLIMKYPNAKVDVENYQSATVVTIDKSETIYSVKVCNDVRGNKEWVKSTDCTLLLHPLSSITDEHAREINVKFLKMNITLNTLEVYALLQGILMINVPIGTDSFLNQFTVQEFIGLADYLRSNSYFIDSPEHVENGTVKLIGISQ